MHPHDDPHLIPRSPDIEPIPLEGQDPPPAPTLPGSVLVRPTADDTLDAIASDLFCQAGACARAFGEFHLALSGGSTPEPLYRRLMVDPAYRQLPWDRTHLWMVDERCVPFDDPRSNFGMIRAIFADHAGIPPDHIHPIHATEPDADQRYEAALQSALIWRPRGHARLDYVVLGLGHDAHTASLFPFSPALAERSRLVARNAGPHVAPPERITLTFPALNAARCLAVLVLGAHKRDAVAKVARGGSVEEIPALGLRPVAGELRWYLDYDACPQTPAPA